MNVYSKEAMSKAELAMSKADNPLSAMVGADETKKIKLEHLSSDLKNTIQSGGTADGSIVTTKLADKAVSIDKIGFSKLGRNLFDKTKSKDGFLINSTTGTESANVSHSASDFIAVEPNTSYVKNVKGHIAFYNASKVFISGINENTVLGGVPFVTPANTAFIRFSINTYTTYKDKTQLEKGEMSTAFVEYGLKIESRTLSPDEIITSETGKSSVLQVTTDKYKGKWVSLIPNPRSVSTGRAIGSSPAADNMVITKTLMNSKFGFLKDFMSVNIEFDKISASNNKGYVIDVDLTKKPYDLKLNSHKVGEYIQVFFLCTNKDVNALSTSWGLYGTNLSIPKSTYTFTKLDDTWYVAEVAYTITQTDLDNNAKINELNFSTTATDGTHYSQKIAAPMIIVSDRLVAPLDVLGLSSPTTDSKWSNKKWNALGDSITAAGKYQSFSGEKLGFGTLRTYGVGGATLADNGSADAFVTRYTAMDADADLVTIMGGTNDFGQAIVIENETIKDKATYKGALRTIIEGLLTSKPTLRIVCITPPPRFSVEHPAGTNSKGNTIQDFGKAMKEVCLEYGIPVVDILQLSGINKINHASFLSDTVHPNDAGHKRIAELLISTLVST